MLVFQVKLFATLAKAMQFLQLLQEAIILC